MRTITLKITHAELLREIDKWSYTIGETVGDDAPKLRHLTQGATDEGHKDLIMSRAQEAWSDVLRILAAYTTTHRCSCGCDEDCCDGDCCGNNDDTAEERYDTDDCSDFVATFYFPNDTYPDIGRNIAHYSRRYIIAKCRAEWEALINRDSTRSEVEAEHAANRLKVVATQRTKVGKTDDYDWYLNY